MITLRPYIQHEIKSTKMDYIHVKSMNYIKSSPFSSSFNTVQ